MKGVVNYMSKWCIERTVILIIGSIFLLTACTAKTKQSSANMSGSRSIQSPATSGKVQTSPDTLQTPIPVSTSLPDNNTVPNDKSPINANPEKVKEAEAYYEQGLKIYYEYRYDEAIKYFDKSIKADPNCYKALNGKGIALCFKGIYVEGMELIEKALKIKPDFAYANFNMAMAYKLQKDYDNALIWFNKALSFDPADTWSYYGISTIYADRNNAEKSLDYLKRAIALDPAVKDVAKEQSHFDRMRNDPQFMELVK